MATRGWKSWKAQQRGSANRAAEQQQARLTCDYWARSTQNKLVDWVSPQFLQNLSTKGEPFGNCFMQVYYCTCIFPALLQIALLIFHGLGFIHARTVIFSFISSCIHAFHSSLLNAPSTRNSALKKSNFNIYKVFFLHGNFVICQYLSCGVSGS